MSNIGSYMDVNLIEHEDTRITHLFHQYYFAEKEVKRRSFLTKNSMKPTETVVLVQPKGTFRDLSAWYTSALVISTSENEKKCLSVNRINFEFTSLSTALSTNLFSITKPCMMKTVLKSTSMETVSRAAHLTAARQPQEQQKLVTEQAGLACRESWKLHKESSTALVTSGNSPKWARPHSQQLGWQVNSAVCLCLNGGIQSWTENNWIKA